jgi:hypothetical protein
LRIQLKPSYSAYPGSHFDRWRKQGYEKVKHGMHQAIEAKD